LIFSCRLEIVLQCCVIVLHSVSSLRSYHSTMIPLNFLSHHILSSANIKFSLYAVMYTRLGRERKLRSKSNLKRKFVLSHAVSKTLELDEDNTFLLFPSIFSQSFHVANNDCSCLDRFMASQIFRDARVFSHREGKISFAIRLPATVYIADASVYSFLTTLSKLSLCATGCRRMSDILR